MLLVASGLALLLTGVAAADREKVNLTAVGQAAARAAVLTRADMGPAAGWIGGAKKTTPGSDSTSPCRDFQPKQSDLVLIGDAETNWKHAGLVFDSEAQVLQTPEMVRLDWQRTVLAPQAFSCMRSAFEKRFGGSGQTRFVSMRTVKFPRIATYTRAYRVRFDFKTATVTVPVMFDFVLIGRGRTEITLTSTAPLTAATVVQAAEVRLAHLLAGRIRE